MFVTIEKTLERIITVEKTPLTMHVQAFIIIILKCVCSAWVWGRFVEQC